MSALTFTLRAPPPCRLDLAALIPSRLRGLEAAAIGRLPLAPGIACGDVFALTSGDADDIAIEGGSPLLDRVGAGMDGGTLRLQGDAGAHVGRHMRAGRLILDGHAGPFAACGLRGGSLEIAGNAGDGLGAPAPSDREGMAGGVVLVRGNAGRGAATRLRRGLILIEGDAGPAAGARMIAGTLIVGGRAGADPGALMRRGTLVLGPGSADLPDTFARTGRPAQAFINLLARYVLDLAGAPSRTHDLLHGAFERCVGDLASLGKGEALVCR